MLQVINQIESIAEFLNSLPNEILKDYKIVLKNDMEIGIHLLVSHKGIIDAQLQDNFTVISDAFDIEEVLESELVYDQYHSWLFKPEHNVNKIDLGLRRRFNNLIDFVKKKGVTIKDPLITTFYSYKGGMGRSTTLAAFASYCAKIQGKRVVIVDCDFEAPGFTNYFDLDGDVLSRKSGVVEYLLDKQFSTITGQQLDIQANYSYKVGFEYVGQGEIFVVPAGNISNELTTADADELLESNRTGLNLIHRDHYLEALAKLDLSSVDNIVSQFTDFVNDLKTQLNPDIVLFDSRTGFNDTFAVLACLSEIIVGFFGNNVQNKTGLEQFLQTVGQIEAEKDVVLVNSNILGGGKRYLEDFKKQVDGITKLPQNQSKFIQEEPLTEKEFKIYQLENDTALQNIGTQFSYKKEATQQKYFDADFVSLIESNKHFQPFFDELFAKIQEHNVVKQESEVVEPIRPNAIVVEETRMVENIQSSIGSSLKELLEQHKENVPVIELRKSLLRKMDSELRRISRYADDAIPEIRDFYFRDCMKDMFNRDKFLIIGSKGTGKTALYQAFRKADLRQKLQARSNIFDDKHLFVNAISIHKEEGGEKYLETTKFNIPKIIDPDFFFERFWVVYVWNAIMLDPTIRDSKYFSNDLPVLPITQEPETVNRFNNYINDNDAYTKIFNILKQLDEQLKKDDKNLIVLFEQLDYVVKPEYWSQGISPLINFWRSNPFTKILPKIFLRSDLFNQLTNITNSQNLPNRSIYIEWTKEELFSYFFKLVLLNAKNEFYLILYSHFNFGNLDFILDLDKRVIENDNQVPTEQKYLRPLVESFFGKYANWQDVGVNNGMGESYDWFSRNLRDANDMISLRPFLNLIEGATVAFLARQYNNRNLKSVLSASFYADNRVREYAVKQHYEDLAKEKGNKALLKFYQYITVDGPTRIKVPTFRRIEFNDMLNQVFMKYKDEKGEVEGLKKIDDMKSILLSNGIIKETDNTNRKYTNYVIPFLYRNYFRVSSKNLTEGHRKNS